MINACNYLHIIYEILLTKYDKYLRYFTPKSEHYLVSHNLDSQVATLNILDIATPIIINNDSTFKFILHYSSEIK